MKILVIAGIIVLLQLHPEQCNDTANTKPRQIIDSNGCLVWTCVPDQPYCCQQYSLEMIQCPAESKLVQILDPKTNCKRWTCVPKQPYCCGRQAPKRKCDANSYSVQVYDPKTGCSIWSCAPCPDVDDDEVGMNMCCLIGYPCKKINILGCPQWECCSNEIYPTGLDGLYDVK